MSDDQKQLEMEILKDTQPDQESAPAEANGKSEATGDAPKAEEGKDKEEGKEDEENAKDGKDMKVPELVEDIEAEKAEMEKKAKAALEQPKILAAPPAVPQIKKPELPPEPKSQALMAAATEEQKKSGTCQIL